MTIHKGGLQRVSPYAWATLPLRVLLLNEASTAAPTVDDVYVSDLVPTTNELDNADYARATVTGLTTAWNATTKLWELKADAVNFGALTGESIDQGVKGWALFAQVTNDADSILIRSFEGDPHTLSGDDVLVSWADGIVLTVEAA